MTRPRRSDAEMSRFPILFALVGILIVSTIVAFVLVDDGSDSSDKQAGKTLTASSAATSRAASSPPASTPSASASPSSNASRSGRTTASSTQGGTQPTTRVTPTATPSTSSAKPPPAPTITAPPYRTITYTVKKGDNLSVIAAWFKLHGYGDLYERNRAVIGDDPDLIFPGQQITISARGMTVSG